LQAETRTHTSFLASNVAVKFGCAR